MSAAPEPGRPGGRSSGARSADVELRAGGRMVCGYVVAPALAARLSPRPFLHPVLTPAGTCVTEAMPDDHLHHLGAGVAVPDAEGLNFWGGRTFVRDRGSVELDDHGAQRHLRFPRCGAEGFEEELSWEAGTGGSGAAATELLRERRTVTVAELTEGAWAVDFTFALTNTCGRPLSIGSPATNGRPGAGYGGFFWRAPKEASAPAVFTADAEGEEAVHGRPADWLALAGASWTLVFAGGTERTRRDPWFVRAAEYPGVGSSLAAERRLPVAPGETLVRRVVTVVADGRLDRAAATALAAAAAAPAG